MPDVTIQDVARAAGVSAASVSNLLNGRVDRMRADTRLRIETVIAELGYRPNPIARQLKTGHAPTLGLLVPTLTNPFFGELAAAIEGFALARGYHVLLCNTLRDAGRESEFAEQLLGLGVRGLITASAFGDPQMIPTLIERGLSIVQFDVRLADVPPSGVDTVSIDNAAAARLATMHLAELEHELIAYATAPATMPNRAARLRGYGEALCQCGLGEGIILPIENASEEWEVGDAALGEIGRLAGRQLAALNPRPTAIVAVNDMVAIGVLSGLGEAGLDVPVDVSVVGLDDIHLAAVASPPLTTMRQPLRDMAELAVSLLLERLSDRRRPSSEHLFAAELIERASTTPLGSGRWQVSRALCAP